MVTAECFSILLVVHSTPACHPVACSLSFFHFLFYAESAGMQKQYFCSGAFQDGANVNSVNYF